MFKTDRGYLMRMPDMCECVLEERQLVNQNVLLIRKYYSSNY